MDGNRLTDTNGHEVSISFKYGTIEDQKTQSFYNNRSDQIDSYDYYKVRGDENGTALFEFMSDHTTVEVGHTKLGNEGAKGLNYISTSHEETRESGAASLIMGQFRHGYNIREFNHSHPNNPFPSGLNDGSKDINMSRVITRIATSQGMNAPTFNIYYTPTRRYVPFTPNSVRSDF